MSAALVLTAIRFDLPTIRYITGRRDERGMVVPGSERIHDVSTASSSAAKRLDQVYTFMQRGNFSAALTMIPEKKEFMALFYTGTALKVARSIRPVAEVYLAWDSLDYRRASKEADKLPWNELTGRWRRFVLDARCRRHLRELAVSMPSDFRGRAVRHRLLAADLLENGRRRLDDGLCEDALQRAYRVADLFTAARVLDRNLDPQDLPREHPSIRECERALMKKGRRGLTKIGGKTRAGREELLFLLRALNDELVESLSVIHRDIARRNKSILAHGFTAGGSGAQQRLAATFQSMEDIMRDEGDGHVAGALDAAGFLTRCRGQQGR
jgi:hypothetical protein